MATREGENTSATTPGRPTRRPLRRPAGAALLAAALLACGCGGNGGQSGCKTPIRADESWPNILLISVDTLRPDHLGCYGYGRDTSPNIDRLAAEGTLFENAVSSTSWTLPAHAALFTGLADSVHGCIEMDRRLDDSRTTLAERLRGVGYATAGFFSGPALHPVFGLAQGFDKYVDCTSYADVTVRVLSAGQSLDGGVVESRSNADVTSPRVCEQVQTWLTENKRRPFFLFVHFWDPHFDFVPPPPYDRRFDPDYSGHITGENFLIDPAISPHMARRDLEHIVALYDGEIAWTDEHIGRVLAAVDALGLRERTVVMLLSDHGEEFFEHGRKGHRQTLFDEVIRIPLIVRFPGRVPAGRRCAEQARLIDVAPTILELAGLPAAPDMMGHSLVPLLAGKPPPDDTLAVSELLSAGRELRSYRRPDRKLIYNEQTKGSLVFDLRSDPGEQSPLSDGSHPLALLLAEDMRRSLRRLDEFRAELPARVSRPQLPENVLRQLQSLGYIGAADKDGSDQTP